MWDLFVYDYYIDNLPTVFDKMLFLALKNVHNYNTRIAIRILPFTSLQLELTTGNSPLWKWFPASAFPIYAIMFAEQAWNSW